MAKNTKQNMASVQHVFIIGSKSIGQYGGYETFVDRLIGEHENDQTIKYHVACKANGDGFMDESKLSNVRVTKKNADGSVAEFTYKNAHIFKIPCPNIGPAVAIYYDRAAVLYSINYCKENHIEHPIFYILTCRIGLFIGGLVKQIKAVGGMYFLNPDGACEIMRTTGEKPENKRLHGTVVFYPKSKLHDIPSWDEQIEYAPVNTSGRLCRTESGAIQPPFHARVHGHNVKSFNSHIKENSPCDARPHRPSPVGRKKMSMALSFHSRVENRTEIQNHQIDYSTQIPECKPEINRKGKAPLPYSAILPAAG